MASEGIRVRDLRKVFRLRSRRRWLRRVDDQCVDTIAAVDGLSFDIGSGEVVGFLGPNGAGKTTTLKMLSGLLHPTSGTIEINGHVPARRQREFLRSIAFVMGQRQQLVWDIPVKESLELNRVIYQVSSTHFTRARDDLVDLLDIGPLLNQTARTLSLGQRMRCEIAASLIHGPRVMFLDEPTLGLDVPMQRRLRAFVKDYNRRHATTILLTSHYMADISELCKRAFIIRHGTLLYDGSIDKLIHAHSPHKRIVAKVTDPSVDLSSFGRVVETTGGEITLQVTVDNASLAVGGLINHPDVLDIQVLDASLDDIMDKLFANVASS